MPDDRPLYKQTPTSPINPAVKPVVSEVAWTLRKDQATYEALLRLIFEDPVPILEEDMKRLKRAAWRR